jgi:hypothetical protein
MCGKRKFLPQNHHVFFFNCFFSDHAINFSDYTPSMVDELVFNTDGVILTGVGGNGELGEKSFPVPGCPKNPKKTALGSNASLIAAKLGTNRMNVLLGLTRVCDIRVCNAYRHLRVM